MLGKVKSYWNVFVSHFSGASNRRLLSLLTLVVIVVALPLTVFMAQQQQDLRQRASEVTTPTSSPYTTLPFPPTSTPTRTPTPFQISSDINRNGCVDITDFNLWLNAFKNGTTNNGVEPDINKNGKYDLLDFNEWFITMRIGENICL